MRKQKTQEPKVPTKHCISIGGFSGLLMMFVVVSIAFMAYLIFMGTDNLANKVLCAPAVIFAAYILGFKFSRS